MRISVVFSENSQTFDMDVGEVNLVHDGQNGATFTPYVSDEGVISWTNDRELENPPPVNIRGKDGLDGKDGKDGKDGQDGQDGSDGITPHIGSNGNWYIGDTDTGKPSHGADGKDGRDGYTPQKGVDYFDGLSGKDGVDGKDGYTPVKGVDYFDGANGKDGIDGKSAYEIAKDNGFEGTEEEWLESLHGEGGNIDEEQLEQVKPLFVHFVNSDLHSYPVTDVSFQDVIDAHNAGRSVVATLYGKYIGHLVEIWERGVSFLFDMDSSLDDHKMISLNLFWDSTTEILPSKSSGSVEGAVLYTAQTLTEEQKAQARANTGSVSGEELEAAKPFFVPVEMGEDGSSVSTEVPFADIVNAYVSNRLVYALVGGTFQLPLVGVDEEKVLFLLNAGMATAMVTLLADGTGTFEVIEAGGGGEAETFVVPVTLSDFSSGTIDVPFEEIANAVSSGKFVYATIEMLGIQMPLVTFDGSSALFSLSMAEGSFFVTVLEDGTAEVAMGPAGGGGGSRIVTVTEDGDNLTTDVPFEQIVSAIESGGTVIAVYQSLVHHLLLATPDNVAFTAIGGNFLSVLAISANEVIQQSNQIVFEHQLEFEIQNMLKQEMPNIVADVIEALREKGLDI